MYSLNFKDVQPSGVASNSCRDKRLPPHIMCTINAVSEVPVLVRLIALRNVFVSRELVHIWIYISNITVEVFIYQIEHSAL